MGSEHDQQERELAELVQRGDSTAFEIIYRSNFERLVKLAYSYVYAPDIAEEIVQDVFLNLWEKRASWSIKSSVGVYLYTAVRNRSLNVVNHNAIVNKTSPSIPQSEAIDDNASIMDLEQRVELAVQKLSQGQREALLLHWKHGRTLAEIGEIMGISSDGARMQLRRAQNALWELVEGLVRE